MTNKNVNNHFNLIADEVVKFEQEHSFKYYFCDAYHDEDSKKTYLVITLFGADTGKHEQFYLTLDEVEHYYKIHEDSVELNTAYEYYNEYVNDAEDENKAILDEDDILYDETDELMNKVVALGEDYKHRGTLLNRVNEDATRVKMMLATYNEYLERGNKVDCEVIIENIIKTVNSIVIVSDING